MSERGNEMARAVDDGAAGGGRSARMRFASSRSRFASSRPAKVASLGSPHAVKFRLVTGILLGIGVAALAIAVALAAHPSASNQSAAWSSWKPTTGGKLGATQIAEHVAPYYRLTGATQLDVVTLINLSNPNAQGTTTGSGLTVAVNTGSSSSSSGGGSGSTSSLSLLSGTSLAYNLCGTGTHNCQLPGPPSTQRMLLLRREALELALYTFKYISGTENVICILPPGRTQVASSLSQHLPSPNSTASNTRPVTIAVVFSRPELQPWLSQPLSSTLSPLPPAVSELPLWQKTQEAGLVDQLTAHGLFSEQIESQQTGGNLLVLNQLPPE